MDLEDIDLIEDLEELYENPTPHLLFWLLLWWLI